MIKQQLFQTRRRQHIFALWVAMTGIVAVSMVFTFSVTAETEQTFESGGSPIASYAAAPPQARVLGESITASADLRPEKLERYLRAYNSPLANHAGTFITVADRYDIDWRFMPALAGVESGFGNATHSSYNAWGWMSGEGFSSWDEAIETVGQGLYKGYFSRGYTSLSAIEERYAPPSAANPDHPWATRMSKYMAEID